MADHSTTTTTTTTPADRRAADAAHTTTTTSTSATSSSALIIGGLIAVLVILGLLFLGGGDDVERAAEEGVAIDATPEPDTGVAGETGPAEGATVDTTEVIEPGAADGGADQPVTTEPNDAGTADDPALQTEGTTGN